MLSNKAKYIFHNNNIKKFRHKKNINKYNTDHATNYNKSLNSTFHHININLKILHSLNKKNIIQNIINKTGYKLKGNIFKNNRKMNKK
jgi:hypothetical protein